MFRRLFVTGVLIALLPAAQAAHAFEIPPNDGYVTDAAGILTDQEDRELEELLKQYRDQTSNEIAIVTIGTLDGDVIEDAALEIGRTWGVGSVKDNGILILVVYEDREVRIEVGYGLEGAVPDLVAKGIIETDIVPAFRDGQYAAGIRTSVDSLIKHIGGEYTAERYAESEDVSGALTFLFFFVIVFFQWIVAILARTKSWWLGGVLGGIGGTVLTFFYAWWLSIPALVLLGLLLDYVVSKTYKASKRSSPWWAGGNWGPGGGGRSGGGGFGGFGGGGFGGGGASGRW